MMTLTWQPLKIHYENFIKIFWEIKKKASSTSLRSEEVSRDITEAPARVASLQMSCLCGTNQRSQTWAACGSCPWTRRVGSALWLTDTDPQHDADPEFGAGQGGFM